MALKIQYQILYILFCFLAVSTVKAQEPSITLHIYYIDSSSLSLQPKNNNLKFDNQKQIIKYLNETILSYIDKGYLTASIDSIRFYNQNANAYIYIGKEYRWAKLSLDSIPIGILNELGIREKDWTNMPLSPKKLNRIIDKILTYNENNGYPFSTVYLDNIKHKANGILAQLKLDKSAAITIDSVINKGNANISMSFIQNYLNIHQGDLYNEQALRSIRKKINNLPYLQESKPWQMDFNIGGNKLQLYLDDKKANQINGLIGLQPNADETHRFMLTADILLSLKNVLSYGESFSLTFQQTQYQSPRFTVSASYPYIAGTQIGLDGNFELFKRDTSYYRTTFNIGLRYQFNAEDYARIYYNANSNRVFSPDLNYVIANKKLPQNADIKSNGIGIEYNLDKTDYKYNPHNGFQTNLTVIGLSRKIRKNDAIVNLSDGSGFDYAQLYDTIKTSSYQMKFLVNASYYLPILRHLVAKIAYQGGYLYGSNLYLNELFQIGGFKILRGFDEQSIYVNQYHIATAEMHVILNQNSYFYIFGDGGYTTSQYQGINKRDVPIGLGAGIALESKSGIFNIAFAVGKHQGAPFQFRQTKIHFGYIAYF